jgi:hypothetical protein
MAPKPRDGAAVAVPPGLKRGRAGARAYIELLLAGAIKAGRTEVQPYIEGTEETRQTKQTEESGLNSGPARRSMEGRNPATQGRNILRPYKGKNLRAEEDGFTLEHFDGEEEGDASVDAGGTEDDGDGVPVVGSGYEIFE